MKVLGDTVYLPLNKPKYGKRKYALIHVDDVERVSRHKWFAIPGHKTFYARATSTKGLPIHHMLLHAFIMRAEKGDRFDHINGDGLDNRKDNLRLASAAENSRNKFKTASAHVTSKFKGVSLSSGGRWFAQIKMEGQPQSLGMFDSEEEAAHAYDAAAVRLFGQFAKTNADMGLYDADKPIRDVARPKEAKHTTRSKLLGQEPKPHWASVLEGSEPEIERNDVPRRIRQRLAAKAAKRAA